MATTVITGVQYSGIWSLAGQANAKALGTWPVFGPKLYSWGSGTNGGLALGNTTSYSSPKQVGSLADWLVISAQYSSGAVAVKTDGTLWGWGSGASGVLGLGNTTNYSSPKQVGSLTGWSKVSAAKAFCIAVKTDGTLWSWGVNDFGQLGLGNTTNYSSPKQVGSLTTWLKLSASYSIIAYKSI